MIDNKKYIFLLEQHIRGTISIGDYKELFKMTASGNMDHYLGEQVTKEWSDTQMSQSDFLSARVSEAILTNIMACQKNITPPAHRLLSAGSLYKLLAAALVGGLMLLGIHKWSKAGNKQSKDSALFAASNPSNTIVRMNSTSREEEVCLEDGTTVILKPAAAVHYPVHFNGLQREIYLTGEALFRVSANPARPFLVYYNNIVTRVLGTSFIIKTDTAMRKVEVIVLSGKVQVYENKKIIQPRDGFSNEGVIVDANQKGLYDINNRLLEATLADEPIPLTNTAAASENNSKQGALVFSKATSVKDIFLLLEKNYGLDIVVENANIYDCVFTGNLSRQNVYKKLEIVCLTIRASYEVKGTRIFVTGKGCK